ncbi:MAG TPA: phage tail tape measure protein [Beijerinckiaceae bacterium]|jgi:phage-related minor tail protein
MEPDLVRDAERHARQLETLDRLAQRFGASLSGAFARNVAEGRRLDGVLGTLGRTLVNATLRAALKPLRSGLTDLFKGGSDTTEFARGGAVSGGRVQPFAAGGVVASPTYFPLGRSLGLMGEAGAEAILPLARGADGRLGVRAGGGDRPLSVTVNIAASEVESFRRSEAQVAASLARAVARGRRGL